MLNNYDDVPMLNIIIHSDDDGDDGGDDGDDGGDDCDGDDGDDDGGDVGDDGGDDDGGDDDDDDATVSEFNEQENEVKTWNNLLIMLDFEDKLDAKIGINLWLWVF